MATKTAEELERDVDAATQAFEAASTPENEAALREALRASGTSEGDVDMIIHGLTYAGFGLM